MSTTDFLLSMICRILLIQTKIILGDRENRETIADYDSNVYQQKLSEVEQGIKKVIGEKINV